METASVLHNSHIAVWIIPLILDAQRTIIQNMIQKEKSRRVECLCEKKKKLRGIVMYTIKLGESAIENFRWGYVSIKRTPSLWSQVSWAAGIRELHLDIYMRETHVQVLVCAQIWGGKIKGANCWMSPQESSLPHAAFLVEKGKTHQVMSLGI